MNLRYIVDSVMEGAAEGRLNNDNVTKHIAELLIEQIKNTSVEELAKRVKDVKIVKRKDLEDTPLECQITLSELSAVKHLD